MAEISYSVKIFRRDEQITNTWSGGATTEIAIYPEDTEYQKRNFTWRISTATVETEKSSFTPLPGIWRVTMVMSGEMTLEHKGHHRVHLHPFEQDSYSGEWTTQSRGKVKNFNLMLAEGCKAELQAIPIRTEVHHETLENVSSIPFPHIAEAFYCADGNITVIVDGKETFVLEKGDMLLVNRMNGAEPVHAVLSNQDEGAVHVIRASIYY